MTTWNLTRNVSTVTTYPQITHDEAGECWIVTTSVQPIFAIWIEVPDTDTATTVRVVFLPSDPQTVDPISEEETTTTLEPPEHEGAMSWTPVTVAGVTGVAIDFDIPASGTMWGWDFLPAHPSPLKMKVRVKRF